MRTADETKLLHQAFIYAKNLIEDYESITPETSSQCYSCAHVAQEHNIKLPNVMLLLTVLTQN